VWATATRTGVAWDADRNIYVVNQFGGPAPNDSVTSYPSAAIPAGGNVAPVLTIAGSFAGLANPLGTTQEI
jgi:hypothetical protein